MPWLIHGDIRLHLRGDEMVVGSGERADHRLDGHGLEPRHFVIALGTDAATIRAVHDDNVVTLNGVQLDGTATPIAHGDVIGAGRTTFVFLERDDVAAAARPVPVSPLLRAAEVWLIDDRARAAYPVSEERVGIGRDPSNTVPLPSSTVSRFHAHLQREAGGLALHPAGSSGTRLNGNRLATPALLAEGDEIEIAGTVLRVAAGPLPPEVVQAHPERGTAADHRRPTVQRMTPLTAEPTRFQPRTRAGTLALLVLLAVVLLLAIARASG